MRDFGQGVGEGLQKRGEGRERGRDDRNRAAAGPRAAPDAARLKAAPASFKGDENRH